MEIEPSSSTPDNREGFVNPPEERANPVPPSETHLLH